MILQTRVLFIYIWPGACQASLYNHKAGQVPFHSEVFFFFYDFGLEHKRKHSGFSSNPYVWDFASSETWGVKCLFFRICHCVNKQACSINYLIQASLMKRLSTSGIITYLIWSSAIKSIGIADSAVLSKILKTDVLVYSRTERKNQGWNTEKHFHLSGSGFAFFVIENH